MADDRKDVPATEPPRIQLDPHELLLLNGIEGFGVIEMTVKISPKPGIRAARDPVSLTTRSQSVTIGKKSRE